jgi:hypothetical protein
MGTRRSQPASELRTLLLLFALFAALATAFSSIALALFEFRILNPLQFARERLGFRPEPKQAEILATQARRVVLNCARQFGKTTVVAAKAVHLAVTRPGWVILVLSENLSQTAEFFMRVDLFLSRLDIRAKSESKKAIGRRLPNGSRIIGIASREQAVRGYTANFVFIDEASRIDDEVIDAVAPAMAIRNGDLWMASTPRGKRGGFERPESMNRG